MKHIKLFESFQFDDVFNDKLWRGIKGVDDEFIDDPSKRTIRLGSYSEGHDGYESYKKYLETIGEFNIPDPTKSVHFILSSRKEASSSINYYGDLYRVIPQKGSRFGFCIREVRGGGLGETWFHSDSIAKQFIGKNYPNFEHHLDRSHYLSQRLDPNEIEHLYKPYIKDLIDSKVIGSLSYDELVKMTSENIEKMYIWTDSPCLMKIFSWV